jgi:DNA-binding CsgD family transcriptional regulator
MTKKEFAEKLFRAFYTIDTHLKNIYAKLHVHKQSEAVAKWLGGRSSR